MFSVHTTPEEFKSATVIAHFGFVSLKKLGHGSYMLRFQTVFCPHENEKPAFSNSSGLKSVFQKLRFRDGLVWMEGLAEEIKLHFHIPPA